MIALASFPQISLYSHFLCWSTQFVFFLWCVLSKYPWLCGLPRLFPLQKSIPANISVSRDEMWCSTLLSMMVFGLAWACTGHVHFFTAAKICVQLSCCLHKTLLLCGHLLLWTLILSPLLFPQLYPSLGMEERDKYSPMNAGHSRSYFLRLG